MTRCSGGSVIFDVGREGRSWLRPRRTAAPRASDKTDVGEARGERIRPGAEKAKELAVGWRSEVAVRVNKPDAPARQAERASRRYRFVKPSGAGEVVRQHDRFGDVSCAVFRDQLGDEVSDIRLRIGWIEPDPAAPLFRQ